MTTFADDTDKSDVSTGQFQDDVFDNLLAATHQIVPEKDLQGSGKAPNTRKYIRFYPYAILFAMICAILLMDAVLPLRDLWFHEAMLTQLGNWPVLPSLALFPGWRVIPPIQPQLPTVGVPDILPSWGMLFLLIGAFVTVFLAYIFALSRLPGRISQRFILGSTLVLGLLFMTIPVVTSPDLYSYIAYARIGVVYGLNPLTTIPSVIHNDPIYSYISWVGQPSAYGPAWVGLTCFFQWLMTLWSPLGGSILAMVIFLRAWGLIMHLSSVALIWSISGSLQRLHGIFSTRKRLLATLAFAWNPLLLLEACTNAHNDTTLLFILLAAIWFLVRAQIGPEKERSSRLSGWFKTHIKPATQRWLLFLAPAILLALGTCLKINLVLLVPGLFFYQWLQEANKPIRLRLQRVGASIAAFAGLIVALYVPFWQGGAIFNILEVNPATYRTINTLPDTLSHLYNSIVAAFGLPLGDAVGSPAEHFMHTLSMGVFVLIYAALFWQILRSPDSLRSIYGLIRWMAITWLLYCAIGSPWYWPWYLITFLGLYALIEASKPAQAYIEEEFLLQTGKQPGITRIFQRFQNILLHPGVVRMLVLSMLTLYCFTTWGPLHSFAPGLPGFQWSYLDGAWAWLLPLIGLKLSSHPGTLLLRLPKPRTKISEPDA
jgi:hypothetical protein